MHSEAEKLLAELRAEVRNDGVVVAAPTDLDLRAASLIERLYREREKLREALRPFAQVADEFLPDDQDDFPYGHLSYGDFRRARAALAEQPQ